MVQHHKRWLEARKARIKQDGDEPNGTYDNRAMVRFIAASHPIGLYSHLSYRNRFRKILSVYFRKMHSQLRQQPTQHDFPQR